MTVTSLVSQKLTHPWLGGSQRPDGKTLSTFPSPAFLSLPSSTSITSGVSMWENWKVAVLRWRDLYFFCLLIVYRVLISCFLLLFFDAIDVCYLILSLSSESCKERKRSRLRPLRPRSLLLFFLCLLSDVQIIINWRKHRASKPWTVKKPEWKVHGILNASSKICSLVVNGQSFLGLGRFSVKSLLVYIQEWLQYNPMLTSFCLVINSSIFSLSISLFFLSFAMLSSTAVIFFHLWKTKTAGHSKERHDDRQPAHCRKRNHMAAVRSPPAHLSLLTFQQSLTPWFFVGFLFHIVWFLHNYYITAKRWIENQWEKKRGEKEIEKEGRCGHRN